MRALSFLALMLIAPPALAQFWGHYENARFGYEIDVPPDFVEQGESDYGDGQVFLRLGAEQVLTVWGGHLLDTFEQEAADRIASAGHDNWGITYQASTPHWAVFSGLRDHRIVYQRMIVLCDGTSYAAYRTEYNIRDLAAMDAVIEGLNRSFAASAC